MNRNKNMNTATSTVSLLAPLINILYQDNQLLVVQSLACEANESAKMLTEGKVSYGAFNLGLHVDDNPTQVLTNRCELLAQLNHLSNQVSDHKVKQIHWLNQVHGNNILDIDNLDFQQLAMQASNADALTTTQQGQALAIMTADCVPIMLYCPQTGRIAGIHAGWQGLANGVIAKTVERFQADTANQTGNNRSTQKNKENNAKQAEIQAWIGACISLDNYEVNHEVLDKLVEGTVSNFFNDKNTLNQTTLSKSKLKEAISKPHQQSNKAWIDLPTLAKIQLQSLGVTLKTEQVPCSYGNAQYYSHRRATHKQQGNTGRMAMLIVKLSANI